MVDAIPAIITPVLAVLLTAAPCLLRVCQSDDLPSGEGLVVLPLDCHRTGLLIDGRVFHSYASTLS
jgi:hypothetical protein